MPWYRTGTVTIAANATTVTGVGTNFAQNARVGDAFLGPDGKWYEVTNIASQTVLSILPAYAGGAVSASANWALTPIQGYNKESADQLREITKNFGGTLGVLGNQTTPAGVRTAIQAAKNGANSDITSLTGLTTALSVAQGGTGGTTQAAARTGLGLGTAATMAATTTLAITAPAGTLPDAAVCRVAEAVWAARSNHGFYTGTASGVNIDTLPNGWTGLIGVGATGTAGTLPPITGSFFWLETQATYTGGSSIQRAVQYAGSATTGSLLDPTVAIRIRNSPGTAWGPWGIVQTSQNIVSTQSDTTTGKILNVGWMGLGVGGTGAPVNAPTVGDLNIVQPAGFSWTTSGTTNAPAGYASGSILMSMNASNVESFQFLSARNQNARFAVRRRVSSTWGSWIEPYMPSNIVGTVSGTAAAPTGAIIERGSGANGDYVRFADGTQICWLKRTDGTLATNLAIRGSFRSADVNWTYPLPFISAPAMFGNPRNASSTSMYCNPSSATSATYYYINAISESPGAARSCDIIAIGRWV